MQPGMAKGNSSYRNNYNNRYAKKASPTQAVEFTEENESPKVENAVLTSDEICVDEKNMVNGRYRGYFKVGNPYQIFGVSYVPQNYEDFEETGTASWYGDDFHGKATANGEVYNMKEMTAAHPTLPLPSLVRVTNLKNGKSVIVRVNDRGPFAKGRIIDVSEKAADALGFKGQGTTKVRIELLRNETDELLAKLKIRN
jgi:rare lipoprotein A (peptidoglycan hydrolase)